MNDSQRAVLDNVQISASCIMHHVGKIEKAAQQGLMPSEKELQGIINDITDLKRTVIDLAKVFAWDDE